MYFFTSHGHHRYPHSFPTRRSSDLAAVLKVLLDAKAALNTDNFDKSDIQSDYFHVGFYAYMHIGGFERPFTVKAAAPVDRKSTRLNSSHVEISYAVFCLKKKQHKHN